MDSHRFDALTKHLVGAGTRRQALAALATGTIAYLFPGTGVDDAAAKCKGYNGKCKKKSSCCKGVGLHCRHDRCRCKKGWKHCGGDGNVCTHVAADPDNCGACGNACPPATPCCINGSCREMCGDSCCANCFVEILMGGLEKPNSDICCPGEGSTTCSSNKQQSSDDRCCWPDQQCVDGECCCDGCQGAVICGGKCCAATACCNGECCPDGDVCETTPDGAACVSASRTCGEGCLAGEICHGGLCCSADRVCGDGVGGDVCCGADEYCEFQDNPILRACTPINYTWHSTYRGHRSRR